MPVNTSAGPAAEASVYGHFGSAPRFVIYDTESRIYEVAENLGKDHEHGQCNPFRSIERESIDALVTGGIGMRALELLFARNIRVFRATGERTAAEVVSSFQDGRLKEIALEEGCSHHGCHGGE
jgi:predicted Fe-Mo cluster-binding NifX family protein